jgi:hypothetical protein
MTRPTHLHKPTGTAVFPGGYPANKIEPLPANYWLDRDREHAFAALRAERDRRIKVCDYLIMPDYPLTEPQRTAWLLYRQLLRDLPGNTIDPTIPAWPVPPGGA